MSESSKDLDKRLREIRKQTREIKKSGKTSYKYSKKTGWSSKDNY